ncbi:metal-dependent hydrolase [Halanaerobacter jeridensis]|uniref:Inner membrane protein n=1 Tax=Halanaerobacter jeridensis TaxID=706427 RepID=A0A938XQU8_9FIRM|nr:metal-dependent hydrolase [Halanaerobacter jeridensis]MBM7555959.1 inner membrane protein [Halanaerobacter jeridensis]
MNYHTHSAFGLLFTLITVKIIVLFDLVDISYLLNGSLFNGTLIKFYLAAVVGALMPDLDHAQSKMGQLLWFISKPLKFFGIKHRGLTHSLVGIVLFNLLSKQLVTHNWIEITTWWGLNIGYISHIVADMMNVQGLPLLFPNDKRFKFHSNITTNSWQEQFLVFIVSLAIIIIILQERSYINLSEIINMITLN